MAQSTSSLQFGHHKLSSCANLFHNTGTVYCITYKKVVIFILTAVNISRISITVLNCFHLVNTILLQILFYFHGSSENFSQTQVMTNPFPIELHFTAVYTPFLCSGRIQ
jgi:hypothetical protein